MKDARAVHVNRALPHESAHKHVAGSAPYVDDLPQPEGLLHAYAGFSELAHGRVTRLEAGERVLLSHATGNDPASVIDAVEFKAQENGRSLGRVPDGTGHWRVCLPTPGAANALAAQQPVISEIMYHPTSIIPFADNTLDEYVEIYNPTGQDVCL